MRKNRIIWAGLLVLSLVGISFFGGPITYGCFALLIALPLVSLLYLFYVYLFFHMFQKVDSKWLVANVASPFYFTLKNDYHILFSGIRVKFYTDFSEIQGLSDETEYEFLPKTGVVKETSILCKYRGEYEVGIKTVVIQDFFRLFTISYKNREPLKVVVRPQMVYLNALKNADINASNKDSYANDSEPDVLARSYVIGDDIRMAHWGLTAKSGQIMIRKRIGQEQLGVGLVVSRRRTSENPEVYMPSENKILEIALALTLFFANNKIPLSYCQSGSLQSQRYVTSLSQIDEFYDFISSTVFMDDSDEESLLDSIYVNQQLLESKSIFIVLQELTPSMEKAIQFFNSHNKFVIVYMVCDKLPESILAINQARTSFIQVLPEADIREVL